MRWRAPRGPRLIRERLGWGRSAIVSRWRFHRGDEGREGARPRGSSPARGIGTGPRARAGTGMRSRLG